MPLVRSPSTEDILVWNCLEDDVAKYDSICKTIYRGKNGTTWLITDNKVPAEQKFGDLWALLAPITICYIWTTKVYKGPLIESIKLIWHTNNYTESSI